MRTAKPLLVACLALGCVIAVLLLSRPPLAPTTAGPANAGTQPPVLLPAPVSKPSPSAVPLVAQAAVPPKEPSASEPLPRQPAVAKSKDASATPALPSAPKQKKEILDPLARAALSFVGADPEAEAYWYAAINDPSLSASERQDLIEDLNEDGLSDPRRPSVEDLPLILNRLALIELLAPEAMDQVNADAFMEAYKDLANMVARLTR